MYENTPATPWTPRLTMASKQISRTSDFKQKNEDISWPIPDLTASASSMYSSQSEFDRLAADFPLIYDESCEDNEFDLSLSLGLRSESRVQSKAPCFADHFESQNETFNSMCESDEESVISALTTPYLSRSPILCATQTPETIRKQTSPSPTPRIAKEVPATEAKLELHAKGALFIQLRELETGCVKMVAQKIVHAVQQDETDPGSERAQFDADPIAETRPESACSFDSDAESIQSSCRSRLEVRISHESRFADLACWGQDSPSSSGSRTVSV
uniref:Uncharacterized protein n=1 Tax=Cryptomonas curvata TaxID=233186 RepID=A0A7S0QCM4_9CRYP